MLVAAMSLCLPSSVQWQLRPTRKPRTHSEPLRPGSHKKNKRGKPPRKPSAHTVHGDNPTSTGVRHEPLEGDEALWNIFFTKYSRGRILNLTVRDYMLFGALSPFNRHIVGGNAITPAWILDEMRADYPSQLVKLSKGENICLQDTTLLHDRIDPRLPTIWGTVGNRAWVEPGFEVYYFDIHLHTTCIPPKPISHSYTFIAIPFAYLDPQRAPGKVYSSTLGQRQVGTSNVYVRPLLEGEEEKQDDKDERALDDFDAVAQQWVSEMTAL